MSNFTVTYNGITDKSLGVHATRRPSIPAPTRKVHVTNLAWRDGSYYDDEGVFNDIAIEVSFSYSSKDNGWWHDKYRAVKNWLLSGDNAYLSFSDDMIVGNSTAHNVQMFYKVHNVEIKDVDRKSRLLGEITAVFYCEPYAYLTSGDAWIQILDYTEQSGSYTKNKLVATLQNNYAICHPIYQITGTGTLTFTVNDKAFIVTVNEACTIDTERMLTLNADSEWVNTTASGDYEDLWLPPGANTWDVSYSSSVTLGFKMWIKPQWRTL